METAKQNNFALKYRPQILEDLVGQEHIIKSLRGMISSKKIVQTFLLTGPSGHGKTTLGRILSRYLNCSELKKDDKGLEQPCGECDSCKKDILKHPDVIEMNMSDTRGIDDVRNLIRNAQMSPTYSFKIFLLDECHSLTGASKEIILKPIEEPNAKTIWILSTTNPEKLTPTIRGRCRQLELKPLTNLDCAKLLNRVCKKENIKLSKEQLLHIADLTSNQPRASLQALNSIADSLNVDKNADIDIASIIEETVQLPPYKTAQKCLEGVYSGDFEKALMAVREASDLISISKLLLTYHEKIYLAECSSKLKSYEYFDKILYTQFERFKGMPKDLLCDITDQLIKCNSEIMSFQTDAKFVLSATVMRITNFVSKRVKK